MNRVKVGVIGCGHHGRVHLRNYVEIPESELVAIAEVNPERAGEAAAEFGVPHHYTDFREMLERHTLDVVSVVTPPVAHRDAAVAAFGAGANVLVDKPLAMNLSEAKDIVSAAKGAAKLLSMCLQFRWDPEVRAVRQFIAEGTLGQVYHTRILSEGHIMNIPGYGVFHRRDQSGGGVLHSTTVHLLDAILWALGNPEPVRASGSNYQKVSKMKTPLVTWTGGVEACDIEDFNLGLVHFADGSTMTLESNWLTHPGPAAPYAQILGDWGLARLGPLCIELEDGDKIVDVTPEIADTESHNGVQTTLQHFCQCVIEGNVPNVRFSEMLDVQRTMDAIYASAEKGEEVPVEN